MARNFTDFSVVATNGTTFTNTTPAAGSTFTVSAATNWPTANFTVVMDTEIILVSSRSGTTCTIGTAGRGFGGSTAAAHTTSALVEPQAVAQDYNDTNTHVNASSAVHGITGNVVGHNDTQTLTNKTIAAASNTLTGLANSSGSYSVSGTGGGTGTATLVSTSVTVPNPCGRAKLILHLTEIGPNEGVITWTLGGTAFKGSAQRHIHHVSGSTINATYTTWVDSPPTGSQTLSIALSSQATASTCAGDWTLEYTN